MILVVGGSEGIGRALVELLLQKGNHLVVMSRTPKDLPLDELRFIAHDVHQQTLPDLEADHLDGIAYLPGSINLKPFHRLTSEEFTEDFHVNVLGAVKVLQTYMPLLKKSDQASVALVSTVAVQQGMPYHSSIASAKGAIEGLVRSLAAEWAPKIRVNAVAPSLVDTPLAQRLLANDDRRQKSADRHPLKRIGAP